MYFVCLVLLCLTCKRANSVWCCFTPGCSSRASKRQYGFWSAGFNTPLIFPLAAGRRRCLTQYYLYQKALFGSRGWDLVL